MIKHLLILSFLSVCIFCNAQIINEQDTTYGNEWIDYNLTYYKLKVYEDKIHKLSFSTLAEAGMDISNVNPAQIQVWNQGEQIPLKISTESSVAPTDYILFYGEKNKSSFDRNLYRNPDEEIPNPYYSCFNDTSIYFLTLTEDEPGLRYSELENDLDNPPSKSTFYLSEEVIEYHSFSNKLKFGSRKTSNHDYAEGFIGPASADNTFSFTADHVHELDVDAELEVQFLSSKDPHNLTIEHDGEILLEETVASTTLLKYSLPISPVSLSKSTTFSLKGNLGSSDKYHLAYAKLVYPRSFDADNQHTLSMRILPNKTERYIEISNYTGSSALIFDLTNQMWLDAELEENVVKFVLPISSTERKVILFDPADSNLSIEKATERIFVNYPSYNSEYLIISHSQLAEGNDGNQIEAYKNYRSSETGGGYKTDIYDIDQLYDQFAYGIITHPMAIKNFINFADRFWSNPKYVLLIGKGRRYKDLRTASHYQEAYLQNFFIPTIGSPASDILLSSKGPFHNYPTIPIGRIAVVNGEEIKIYLDKIIQKESYTALPQSIDDQVWQKRVLHLSGGDINIQQTLRAYMAQMELTFENTTYAPDVTTIYKYSDDVVSEPVDDKVFDLINDGVSIVTFFGHSSSNTLDFSVDIEEKYQNNPKYPMLISLGCSAGNLYTASRGLAERFCLLENKGYSHFLSTSGPGLANELYLHAQDLYKKIGTVQYGQGIGDAVKSSLIEYGDVFEIQSQQLVLFGDPAVKTYPSPGPDFVIDYASTQFNPSKISVEMDSFSISFDLINLGSRAIDSINVLISQSFPDNTTETVTKMRVLAPAFKQTFTVNIPGSGKKSAGLNTFKIVIDSDKEVSEFPIPEAETNNALISSNGKEGIDLFIFSSAANPISPPNFSIVNTPNVQLIASTANIFEPEKTYILECDTSQLFDSPSKKSIAITQSGGLIKWNLENSLINNTVYYWRISPDSISESSAYLWQVASFLYNEDLSNGWNQSHYYQFLSNSYTTMGLNENRRFEFVDNYNSYNMDNKVWFDNANRPSFTYNFIDSKIQNVLKSGLSISVIDPVSSEPWLNTKEGVYNDLVIAKDEHYNFYFKTNTQEERSTVAHFLNNEIPTDHYVLVMTGISPGLDINSSEWAADSISTGSNLFQVFENFGATKIRQLATKDSVPYAFYFQKGNLEYEDRFEEITTYEGEIVRSWKVKAKHSEGVMRSPIIGPAKAWGEVEKIVSENEMMIDSLKISLIGIDAVGKDTLLIENLIDDSYDLSDIDAEQIPYLWFNYYNSDNKNRTAVQLENWRVFYDGIGDLALNPAAHFSFDKDTVPNGTPVSLSIAIENVSQYAVDSSIVQFSHRDPSNNTDIISSDLSSFAAFEQKTVSQSFETFQKPGSNQIFIEVNPFEIPVERSFANNVGIIPFEVLADNYEPLLDVTYDGIHIMDGDIISSSPNIVIQLEDDNMNLLLNDTSIFSVYLQYEGETENRLFFNQALAFIPAVSGDSKNRAKVIYNPTFIKDGNYRIRIEAEDISGNQAGAYDYQKNFEIITETSISNVFNYPNPFVNSTQFVYTLTGNESPNLFSIQIFTVSGRLVKEITQDDIGPLKVGKHMTDYTWDGTDEYGDKLASGVYLYRFVAKDHNFEEIKKFDTGTDEYFNQGFGKMVILN